MPLSKEPDERSTPTRVREQKIRVASDWDVVINVFWLKGEVGVEFTSH